MIDPTKVTLRDLETGDIGWLIQRHGELYFAHEGFDSTFEVLVAEVLVDFVRNRDPQMERAWIAVAGPLRLGSVFCVHSGDPGVAKLRLFLLEPVARGLGLGQILLDACMSYAGERGYQKMRLWTHESHRAACALYARNGFVCVSSAPVHSFGQDLIEQTWEMDLI